MFDIKTQQPSYSFPLDNITLKYMETGGYVDAQIDQLTRWRAYWYVDRVWWKFRGPFVRNCPDPEDRHWRWGSYVRRLRKNVWTRCAYLQTPDGHAQGAIVYRRDGASLLEEDAGSVYIEYLSAAPCNRRDYVEKPLYLGVGEGLLYLAILHSYVWGLGGRVSLFSLPRANGFYKKFDFVETGERKDRMIHYELPQKAAVSLLEEKRLIL